MNRRAPNLVLTCVLSVIVWDVATPARSRAQPDHARDTAPASSSDAGTSEAEPAEHTTGRHTGTAAPAPTEPLITPPRPLGDASIAWPPDVPVPDAPVDLLLTIDASGAVTEVELPDSYGELADDALREAALELHFEPARRGGDPIAARVRYRFQVPAPTRAGAPTSSSSTEAAQPSEAGDQAHVNDGSAVPAPELVPDTESDAQPGSLTFSARAHIERPPPGAASRVKLQGRELTMIPGTFGEPLRVVATLPGVARSPFGLGLFVVRGAAFQNTGFFVDGFAVPLLYHLGAGPAIISSRLVDQLDFYPGGYPVNFGQFSAGIISLRTAPPKVERLQLEAEVDLLRASAHVTLPFPNDKGSVTLAFRRSYYELILPLITKDASLSYTDYQLRLDYKLRPNLKLALFFFGSRDRFDSQQDLGSGGSMGSASQGLRYEFDQVIASLKWHPIRALQFGWSGTIGGNLVALSGQSSGDAPLGTRVKGIRLGERLELVLSPSPMFQTSIGAEISAFLYTASGSVPSIGELPAIPPPGSDGEALLFSDRMSELVFAPYIEQVIRPQPFEFTLGLRSNYYRYGDVSSWVLDPRSVVRLQLWRGVKLKAASGLFAQPPLPFQLVRGLANPALPPTRAWQSSFGTELRLMSALEIESSLFYSKMWQIARGSGRLALDDSGNPVRPLYRADGEGRAYGLELLVRRKVQSGFFGWLSYTLSRSERFIEGGRTVVFAFDQTHVLNLALSYATAGWTFGARFTLATGRPVGDLLDVASTHTVFDADADDFDPSSGGRRVRLPTYHQLDVRIDRNWTLGPVHGSVYIDIINVYNAHNSEGYRYSYDFTRRGRLPGLPFLPTVGVRGVLQ